MSLDERHDLIIKATSDFLKRAGYIVTLGASIGDRERKKYVDILATSPAVALLVEVKGFETGSSDVLAMKSNLHSAMHTPSLEGKSIEAIIISPGTVDPAKDLSKELGVKVVEIHSAKEVERNLGQLIQKSSS